MKQEFVTLPRHVAEHAVASIEMLNAGKWTQVTALVAALRTALDQPQVEQEPVAWINYSTLTGERRLGWECESELASDPLYTKPQPPTDQQPYLWYDAERDRLWNQEDAKYMDMSGTIPLYTHPQPKREPLTDEQVMQAVRHLYQSDFAAGMGFPGDLDVARAIEAAHNIK